MKNVQAIAHLPSASPLLRAIESTPRERFVPLDAIAESAEDVPVAFGRGERSTVSAMHAYALTFQLADLSPGLRVLDLGAGSGYGTAILARLLGPSGFVRSVEIDPELVALAKEELEELVHEGANIEPLAGDALDPRYWTADLDRVVVGFALPEVPSALLRQLKPGAIVVAPIVTGEEQRLARVVVSANDFEIAWHGQVRYVPAQREAPAPVVAIKKEPRRLPLV